MGLVEDNSLLIGKKVLLLSPSFFQYEKEIKDQIEKMGAEVAYINNDPSNIFLVCKGVFERIGLSTKWMIKCFESSVERKIKNRKFDYVLVICGWAVTSRLSKIIRERHLSDNGKMFLYYWDSLSLLGDDISRWDFFDHIFTFDKNDYKIHADRMSFLPLFYINSYSKDVLSVEKDIDLFTVGSFKINRYLDIEHIKKNNPDIHIYSYMFEHKWLIKFHKFFRPKYKDVDISNIKFKKLTANEIVFYYSRSNAILDIPRLGQNGLTMRTFECLGMGKKMVTTNPNVVEYDFYNCNNIYVMDARDKKLPNIEWFKSDFVPLPQDISEKYSLQSWIKHIFFYE